MSAGLGAKPDLKWLGLARLYVPAGHQRSVEADAPAENINHVKKHFNWGDCGGLTVCPLTDAEMPQYAVIDGQHGLRAAGARGRPPTSSA